MFDSLTQKLSGALNSLRSRGKISQSDIEDTCQEIHQALLEADVALPVVTSFINNVRERSLGALPTLQSGTNQAQVIFEIINQTLIEILGAKARRIRFAKTGPTVIMLAGLQGAGKTSMAGKLAKFYADQGNTPILVAADLQRPNAVTQLQVLGEGIGISVFAPEPGNGRGVRLRNAGRIDPARLRLDQPHKEYPIVNVISFEGNKRLKDEARLVKHGERRWSFYTLSENEPL